jgi:hypothetical protein
MCSNREASCPVGRSRRARPRLGEARARGGQRHVRGQEGRGRHQRGLPALGSPVHAHGRQHPLHHLAAARGTRAWGGWMVKLMAWIPRGQGVHKAAST